MDVELKVDGMSCAHCEKTVKEALFAVNGVKHVEVHLKDKIVNVKYDQSVVKLEEICNQIEEQGYDVVR